MRGFPFHFLVRKSWVVSDGVRAVPRNKDARKSSRCLRNLPRARNKKVYTETKCKAAQKFAEAFLFLSWSPYIALGRERRRFPDFPEEGRSEGGGRAAIISPSLAPLRASLTLLAVRPTPSLASGTDEAGISENSFRVGAIQIFRSLIGDALVQPIAFKLDKLVFDDLGIPAPAQRGRSKMYFALFEARSRLQNLRHGKFKKVT